MTRFSSEQKIVFLGDLTDFDDRTDRLYEALLKLDGVVDPDLTVNLKTGEVCVAMTVIADDYLAACEKAICDLRSAIHEVGDSTPGWEQYVLEVRSQAAHSIRGAAMLVSI